VGTIGMSGIPLRGLAHFLYPLRIVPKISSKVGNSVFGDNILYFCLEIGKLIEVPPPPTYFIKTVASDSNNCVMIGQRLWHGNVYIVAVFQF
jgi:hypothetical protein